MSYTEASKDNFGHPLLNDKAERGPFPFSLREKRVPLFLFHLFSLLFFTTFRKCVY